MAVTPLDVERLRLFSVTSRFPREVWYAPSPWRNTVEMPETTPLASSQFMEDEVEGW